MSDKTQRLDAIENEMSVRNRALADVIVTLEDKAWKRGWLIGLVTGIAVTLIVLGFGRLIGVW